MNRQITIPEIHIKTEDIIYNLAYLLYTCNWNTSICVILYKWGSIYIHDLSLSLSLLQFQDHKNQLALENTDICVNQSDPLKYWSPIYKWTGCAKPFFLLTA